MALVNCKECGVEVSSEAESCPKCGARVKPKSKAGKVILWIVGAPVALFLVVMIYSGVTAGPPEQRNLAARYRDCMSQWRASNGSASVAQLCEKFRAEYAWKYGKEP